MALVADMAPWRGFTRSAAFELRSAAPSATGHAVALQGEASAGSTWASQPVNGPLPLPPRCDLRFFRVYVESVSSATPPSAALNVWLTSDAAGDRFLTKKLDDVVWETGLTTNFGGAAVRLDVPWVAPGVAAGEDSVYAWLWATDAVGLTCRCEIYWDSDELTRTHAGQIRARRG